VIRTVDGLNATLTRLLGVCDALHAKKWGLYLRLDTTSRENFFSSIPILVQRIQKLLNMR